MSMIDLTKEIIIKDTKGVKYKLTDVGKKVLFSRLWRDNYVTKIPDYTKIKEMSKNG